jgi:phosphomethylpyrimidine synthase
VIIRYSVPGIVMSPELCVAAKQNQPADGFILAGDVETGMAGVVVSGTEAETGMAQMSEKFREIGSELYVGANGREHD